MDLQSVMELELGWGNVTVQHLVLGWDLSFALGTGRLKDYLTVLESEQLWGW